MVEGQDGNQDGQDQQGNQDGGGMPSFEDWLGGQDEGIQGLVNEHVAGLRSALGSEREQRRGLEKELREAAKTLDEGSEARTRLEGMADELDGAERRADFYEAAHGEGVSNLRLAWLAVQENEDLVDRRGVVNFAKLREGYPELFGGGQKTPAGNAGSGTGNPPPAAGGMNAFIRTAAGRG